MVIRFTEAEAFFRELSQDKQAIERKIVRVDWIVNQTPMATRMALIATAKLYTNDVLVYIRPGPILTNGSAASEQEKLRNDAQNIENDMRDAIHQMGLEAREGVFEADKYAA